jgi:hypothetical protein
MAKGAWKAAGIPDSYETGSEIGRALRQVREVCVQDSGNSCWSLDVAVAIAAELSPSALTALAGTQLLEVARKQTRAEVKVVTEAAIDRARYEQWCRSPEGMALYLKQKEAGHKASERAKRLAHERFEASVRDYVATQPPEWLFEVLGLSFALPNGKEVTFGDATRSEHEQVIAMCDGQSRGAVKRAARHQQAIDLLDASGARCLRDAAEGVAA